MLDESSSLPGSTSPTTSDSPISILKSPVNLTRPHGSKSLTKKSFVWKYFQHPIDESGVCDYKKTVCSICKAVLAFNNSGTTTTMLNHLKSRHGDVAKNEEDHRKVGNGNKMQQKFKIDQGTPKLKDVVKPTPKISPPTIENQAVSTKSSRPATVTQSQQQQQLHQTDGQEFDKITTLQAAFAAQSAAMAPFLNPFLNSTGTDFSLANLQAFPNIFHESTPFYQINNQLKLRHTHDDELAPPTKKTKRKSQSPLKKESEALQLTTSPQTKDFKKLSIQFLAKDLLPVETIYRPGFQGLLTNLSTGPVNLPSKQDLLENTIHLMSRTKLQEYKAAVKAAQTTASLSVHCWNENHEDWIAIFANYLDSNTQSPTCRPLICTKLFAPLDLAVHLIECVVDCFDLSTLVNLPVITNANITPQLETVRHNPDVTLAGRVLDKLKVVPCLRGVLDSALEAASNIPDLNSNLAKASRDDILNKLQLKETYLKLVEDSSVNCASAVLPILAKVTQQCEITDADTGLSIKLKENFLDNIQKAYMDDPNLYRFFVLATFLNPQYNLPSDEKDIYEMVQSEVKSRHCSDSSVNRRKRNSIVAQQSAEALRYTVSEELSQFEELCTSNLSAESRDFRAWWTPCLTRMPNLYQIAKRYFALPATSCYHSKFLTDAEYLERRYQLSTDEKAALLILHCDNDKN